MKILLSPAKTFAKREALSPRADMSEPLFQAETEQLVAGLEEWKPEDFTKIMGVSENIAHLNHERYQNWSQQEPYRALEYFKGGVYKGLSIEDFTVEDWEYANNTINILSGLYGLLRAHDGVANYRLEMGTSWAVQDKPNLYAFWGEKIAQALNKVESEVIVNLASVEYFKSVDRKVLKAPVITPIFKENKNGTYKIIAIHAKKARGLMARYATKNKIAQIEDLKQFNLEDYRFEASMSTDRDWVFVR